MLRTIRTQVVPQNRDIFLKTMEIGKALFDYYTTWALENKCYSKSKCHKETYETLRAQYTIFPSALLQTVRDNALESCKQNKFKVRPKKRTLSLRYDKRTFTLRGNILTLASCLGRQKVEINIPEYAKKYTTGSLKQVTAFIGKRGQFFLSLVYDLKNPKPSRFKDIVGIDQGIRHLAVTSDGQFFSKPGIRAVRRKYLHNRKELQKKGTRSSKRKLKSISGKEKRLVRDTLHCVTKNLSTLPVSMFVLENLSSMRTRKNMGRYLNKRLSDWPHALFAFFLSYKAQSKGKTVAFVDPRYTSQKCSRCKQRHDTYRKGSRFRCAGCKYTSHADINAALNIKENFLISRLSIGTGEQAAVNQPNRTLKGSKVSELML